MLAVRKGLTLFTVIIVLTTVCLAAGAATGKTKITFGLIWPGDKDALWNGVVEAFERAHPNIEVELINQSWPGTDQLITWAAGGVLPDVFYVWDADVPALTNAGVLANLTSLIERDGLNLEEVLLAPALSTYNRSQLYTFPFNINYWFAAYNSDLLAKFGVAPPGQNWTWDEFHSAVRATTTWSPATIAGGAEGSGSSGTTGFAGINMNGTYFETFVVNFGARFFDENGKFALDSEAGREALNFWQSLVQQGYAGEDPFSGARWFSGDAGMTFVDTAWLGQWSGQDRLPFKWGTQALPALSAVPRHTIANTGSFGIAATSEHPTEAWEFLRYLSLGEGQLQAFVNYYGNIPAARAYVSDALDAASARPNSPANLVAVFDAGSRAILSSAASSGIHNQTGAAGAITEAVRPYLLGEIGLEQALSDARIGAQAAMAD